MMVGSCFEVSAGEAIIHNTYEGSRVKPGGLTPEPKFRTTFPAAPWTWGRKRAGWCQRAEPQFSAMDAVLAVLMLLPTAPSLLQPLLLAELAVLGASGVRVLTCARLLLQGRSG